MSFTYNTRTEIVERIVVRVDDSDTGLSTPYEATRSADGDEFGYGYVVFRGYEAGEMVWLGDAMCRGTDDDFRLLVDGWVRDYHERVRPIALARLALTSEVA